MTTLILSRPEMNTRTTRRKFNPKQRGAIRQTISVWLERRLLKETDIAAARLHISRSELIARGLRNVLKRAG
jgi:hypothetical protein